MLISYMSVGDYPWRAAVTPEVNAEHEHRIVVGVDGSASSKAALAWALGQAQLTGAVVEAVTAWDYPATYGYAAAVVDVDWEGLAAQVLSDAIAEVAPDAGPAAIRRRVSEGNAASVLLDASAGADLLVVGSRGHGGFVEALLGSVSQHMVHHAACPVVVIRGPLT
jgi:nucleotide-binding universal stress UspA family protein